MAVTKINIIAIQEKYLDTITKQVKEILGDKINIHSITVKDLQNNTVTRGDIVVISNSQIKGLVTQLIPEECPIIVAKRDINFTNTIELLNLPPGQQILVVNDNKKNAEETVQSLRETVFEHNYQAYSPEENIPKTIDYIVTPGERHLLPRGLSNIIDIGARLLDISTFEEIVNLLKFDYPKSKIVKRYFKACVSLSGNYDNRIASNKDIRNVAQYHFKDIISASESMKEVEQRAKHYSMSSNVFHIHIEGKPGTGKSMLAQAVHNYSNITDRPFVSINCASGGSVIEKMLFGSENDEEVLYDLIEFAKNGTLCIEEIGKLSLSVQERLYRVLVKGDLLRSASSGPLQLRCKVITTNSKSCKELVQKGLFRQDLYNLLSKYSLKVPALSERMEDLLPLIDNVKQRIKRSDIEFTNEVISFFKEYNWESNVKELYNVITYLSLLEEDPIGMEFLPFHLRSKADEQKFNNIDVNNEIISKIEEHGFLDESTEILSTFYEGKKVHTSYGRKALKNCLEEKGLILSEQQLRMRLEVLQGLGLTIVRQGRAGSTISRKGEEFIENYLKTKISI